MLHITKKMNNIIYLPLSFSEKNVKNENSQKFNLSPSHKKVLYGVRAIGKRVAEPPRVACSPD